VRFCNVLQRYGDLLNTPSVGSSLQHFYTNVQANVSPAAVSADDSRLLPLISSFPIVDSFCCSDYLQFCTWGVCGTAYRRPRCSLCAHSNGTVAEHSGGLQAWSLCISRLQNFHHARSSLVCVLHRAAPAWWNPTISVSGPTSRAMGIPSRNRLLSERFNDDGGVSEPLGSLLRI
jgi:hypothetical protein